MTTDLTKFVICPNCGSTDYIADYPAPGHMLCDGCGHECTEILLTNIASPIRESEKCQFCGEEGKDNELLYDEGIITVYKCKKCGKPNGYCRIEDEWSSPFDPDERDYPTKAIKVAKKEGKPTLSLETSRKIAHALKKTEKTPKAKCQESLSHLMAEKSVILKEANIDSLILGRACNQARNNIDRNGPYTQKQLQILYPAAILEAQETLLRLKKINDKRITEHQLEEIFSADRKTLRKWKKDLIRQNQIFRFGIHFRQKEQQREFGTKEFPTEVNSVTKLETPYKDMCDFCETEKLLNWRINYSNGSWSDICTNNFDRLKNMSLVYGWETERTLFST